MTEPGPRETPGRSDATGPRLPIERPQRSLRWWALGSLVVNAALGAIRFGLVTLPGSGPTAAAGPAGEPVTGVAAKQAHTARLTVPSSKPGIGVVELGNVADFEEAQGPSTIERFSRQRQVVVSANLEGKALGDGVDDLAAFVKTLDLPADYRWEFIGQAKNLNDTMANFVIAFALAFLFMYMILAAQFESLVHPITILRALPLTIPFAILSLILLRTNLDIYAMFGLFMLFGIVKKNGILEVDYTNVLRSRGVPLDRAILEANAVRLRPILVTTVMLVAAMIPMAMGEGPGAASRAGMAKVILGGQVLSLLLTLLLTPVAYSLWDDLTVLFLRVWNRNGDAARSVAGQP